MRVLRSYQVHGKGRFFVVGQNFLGFLLLVAICSGMHSIAPSARLNKVELKCGENTYTTTAKTRRECKIDDRYVSGCHCRKLTNPWSRVFWCLFAPLLVSFVGFVILGGRVVSRCVVTSLAVVIHLLDLLLDAFAEEPNAAMAIVMVPFFGAVFAMLAAIWMAAFHLAVVCYDRYRSRKSSDSG